MSMTSTVIVALQPRGFVDGLADHGDDLSAHQVECREVADRNFGSTHPRSGQHEVLEDRPNQHKQHLSVGLSRVGMVSVDLRIVSVSIVGISSVGLSSAGRSCRSQFHLHSSMPWAA